MFKPDRLEQYLLKTNARAPRSTDTTVWPSVFNRIDMPLPSWTGTLFNLWADLAELENHLMQFSSAARVQLVMAAFTIDSETIDGIVRPSELKPSNVDASWEFLGFDVSDKGFISGLMNCGYDPDERQTLRSQWADHLNDHHLFEKLDDARAFVDVSNGRVPEHAPFFAFGLWQRV